MSQNLLDLVALKNVTNLSSFIEHMYPIIASQQDLK